MLVLVDLFEFEVIVAPEFGVASSHRVGSFQQVVTEISVAGFNHPGMLSLKFTGLVFVPDKTSELGDRGLGIEAANVANLGDNTGGINLANARDRRQRVWDNFKLLFNSLIQSLTCFSKARMEAIETAIA